MNECLFCADLIENNNNNLLSHIRTCNCNLDNIHTKCIEKWWEQNSSCPLCRNQCLSRNEELLTPLLQQADIVIINTSINTTNTIQSHYNWKTSCCLLVFFLTLLGFWIFIFLGPALF